MSRARTRPTRDDTREKLFEAAARVFEEQGIGGASIEAIAAAAGFTRGAFYSNFKSKDELIIAMLEDHVEQSIGRIRDLLEKHKNLADFIDALKTMNRSQQDPLGRSPLLHMEMILFVARAEKRRPNGCVPGENWLPTSSRPRRGTAAGRQFSIRHGPARWCWRWKTASVCTALSIPRPRRPKVFFAPSAICSVRWEFHRPETKIFASRKSSQLASVSGCLRTPTPDIRHILRAHLRIASLHLDGRA
jgi:AcrR family transcriptional regulator